MENIGVTPRILHEKRKVRFSSSVIIRSDAVKKDGMALICLQVFINGARLVLGLDLYANPDDFDRGKGLIKKGRAFASDYNLIIGEALAKANDIFVHYRLSSFDLTPEIFRNEFLNPIDRSSFIEFYKREHIARKKEVAGRTWEQEKYTLDKLTQFRPQLKFAELTYDFVVAFDRWMKNKLENKQNTRSKTLTNVKGYINIALKKGFRFKSPFVDFKIKPIKGEREALTRQEVMVLMEHYEKKDVKIPHKEALRRFLFCALGGGMRIGDMKRLRGDMIYDNTIIFTPIKTRGRNKIVKVPLPEVVKKYIDLESKGLLFPGMCEQYINRLLKEIFSELKINRNITFHMARHTFASLFLQAGGRVEVLQDVLQHSEIETTMIYVHIEQEQKKTQMSGIDAYMKKSDGLKSNPS